MLSTQYRLRLEGICKSIASGQEVSLDDMIWAGKLSKRNTSARGMLNAARRIEVAVEKLKLFLLSPPVPQVSRKLPFKFNFKDFDLRYFMKE